MRNSICIYFVAMAWAVFLGSPAVSANENPPVKTTSLNETLQHLSNPDSTRYVRVNGVLHRIGEPAGPIESRITFRDTMFYNPLFLPVVFDGRVLPIGLNFYNRESLDAAQPRYHLISPDSTLLPLSQKNDWRQQVRQNYFLNNFSYVRYNVFSFRDIKTIAKQSFQSPLEYRSLITGTPVEVNTKIDLEKFVPARVYWTKNGEHSLQVNQNQFSDNWYSGGNNNYSVITYHKILLNYRKNKVSWNNTFEWKLSFQRTPADTLHNLSMNEDYFRIYTVVGVDASQKWSYTIKNEIKTPFFNSYKINTATKKAALFSPLVVNTGIGLTYNYSKNSKADKNRKFSISLDFSPVSINYTYVGDDAVDETSFGVDSGKRAKLDFGSTYNMNLSYTYNRNSSVTSRLKYFTSYSKVIVESENKFNFAFTRVLSSTIYLYMRYDDGVAVSKKSDQLGYFQYNELIGFGLSYKW